MRPRALARIDQFCLKRKLEFALTAREDARGGYHLARKRLNPRPITVDGVGDKNAGAHDAEECSDDFQHCLDP